MSDGLEWMFKLLDQITGPAKQMEKALGGLGKELKRVEKTADGMRFEKLTLAIGRTFGTKTQGAFLGFSRFLANGMEKFEASGLGGPLKAAGGALLTGAVAVGGFALEAVKMIVAATAAAGVATGALVAAGYHFAIMATEADRNDLFAMKGVLGSFEKADDVLKKIAEISKKAAMSEDVATDWGRSLLGAGMKEDDLKPVLLALSDITAASGGKTDKAQQLMQHMMRMQTMDKIGKGDLMALAEAGVPSDKVFETLAKMDNTTPAIIKEQLKHGTIRKEKAMDAILQTIQRDISGGQLGSLGEEYAKGSVKKQAGNVENSFKKLFEMDPKAMEPLTAFMATVTEMLDPDTDTGMRLKAVIGDIFGTITDLFKNVDADDIETALFAVADTMEWILRVAKQLGRDLSDAWTKAQPAIERLTEKLDGSSVSAEAFADIIGLTMVGFIDLMAVTASSISDVLDILDEIEATGDQIYTSVEGLIEDVKGLAGSFEQAGKDLVQGLWNGITGRWGTMLVDYQELVKTLPAALKTILRIGSPSKVFEELGEFTAEGFQVGVMRPDVNGTVANMVTPPRVPVTLDSLTGAGGLQSRAGGIIHIDMSGFQLTVQSSGDVDADDIVDRFESVALERIKDALDQAATEGG